MAKLALVALALLLTGATAQPEPESSCPLCITSGACGCYLGHVVCCDGLQAYGCSCAAIR